MAHNYNLFVYVGLESNPIKQYHHYVQCHLVLSYPGRCKKVIIGVGEFHQKLNTNNYNLYSINEELKFDRNNCVIYLLYFIHINLGVNFNTNVSFA